MCLSTSLSSSNSLSLSFPGSETLLFVSLIMSLTLQYISLSELVQRSSEFCLGWRVWAVIFVVLKGSHRSSKPKIPECHAMRTFFLPDLERTHWTSKMLDFSSNCQFIYIYIYLEKTFLGIKSLLTQCLLDMDVRDQRHAPQLTLPFQLHTVGWVLGHVRKVWI